VQEVVVNKKKRKSRRWKKGKEKKGKKEIKMNTQKPG